MMSVGKQEVNIRFWTLLNVLDHSEGFACGPATHGHMVLRGRASGQESIEEGWQSTLFSDTAKGKVSVLVNGQHDFSTVVKIKLSTIW